MQRRKWIKYMVVAASLFLLTGVTVLADAQSVNNVITAIESIDLDDINEDQVSPRKSERHLHRPRRSCLRR